MAGAENWEVRKPRKPKPKAVKAPSKYRVALDLVSRAVVAAFFWYALLSVIGALVLSIGVAWQYGIGHGLIAFGGLCVVGAEVVRQGMIRA